MKINDKSLSKFASSGAPADKEGYLLKKGEVNRGFQKRWFVLKGNLLFYYERRQDKEPIGVVVLEGCTIELSENGDGFTFQINFPGSGTRIYVLSADTQEEMEAWMKILSCASYDYMKLMVSELQRQIEEMNSDTQKNLVENALRDSERVTDRYSQGRMSQNSEDYLLNIQNSNRNSADKSHQRFNPFNVDGIEGVSSNQKSNFTSHVNFDEDHFSQTKARSFKDLHEEYKEQIECLSELWNTRQRTSMLPSSPL